MFAGLFDGGDSTSSHLFVVLCTGVAFLAVQLILSVRCYVRLRRQERVIDSLPRETEPGSGDREQLEARLSNAGWVHWVIANYSTNATGTASNFTRDDALRELDARITSNGDYLLLQRMGVMAPLLGVVLTVIGFYWLKFDEQEQSLQAILLAVAPLVSGVGTGAVLALINQALLHVVGHRAESLQMSARQWFDSAIWRRADLAARSARGRAVMAMDQLASSIREASLRYVDGAGEIQKSSATISRAASQFHDIIHSVGGELRGLPDALGDVRRATMASAGALEELIGVGSRAAADLDVSVAAFRTTIDRQFKVAAKLQHRSGRLMAKSAQQLDDATERIRSGSHGLKHSAEASQASFQRLDESLRKNVLTGNQNFRDAVDGLTAQVAAFSHDVQALGAVADSVAGEFNQAVGGLMPAVSAFRETIDHRFTSAVAAQTTNVEDVNRSMQRLQEAANGMSQGATTLNAMLREMSEFVRQTKATHETLAQAAGNLNELLVGLRLEAGQRADSVAAASHPAAGMDDFSTSLSQVKKHLAEFVSAIDPATQRLAVLHETLADLEEAAEAYSEFDDPDANYYPDQAHSPIAESGSQTGFLSWLSRRPR